MKKSWGQSPEYMERFLAAMHQKKTKAVKPTAKVEEHGCVITQDSTKGIYPKCIRVRRSLRRR